MSPRLSILAGLLVGIVVAALVLGGIVAFAPDPVPAGTPPPSLAVASPSASASASASASGSASPSASSPATSSQAAGSASPSAGSASGDGAFHVGEPAPALVVPQVGGGTIDLAALRGKPVWLNFMATWCPSCQDEFPLMSGFAARYAEEGLVVVAVDVREEEGVVAAFAERLGATFPMGLDGDGAASRAWGSPALPVHFWIDADGIVRHGALGGIGPDIMVEGLKSIMPGVDVKP